MYISNFGLFINFMVFVENGLKAAKWQEILFSNGRIPLQRKIFNFPSSKTFGFVTFSQRMKAFENVRNRQGDF